MGRTLLAAALALLMGCGTEASGPVRVHALVLTSSGEYTPQEVTLTTVTDVARLEGGVARLVGGARIVLDSDDPALAAASTDEELSRALLKSGGRPVTPSFLPMSDGSLWPADFHTWNLVTTYWSLERAAEYFQAVGQVPAEELGTQTVYYFPEFVLADTGDTPLRDNAIYFAPVQGFLVLPFEELQAAPLAINAGVLAHEYAHLVFNKRVYGGRSLPAPMVMWFNDVSAPGLNLLKSLDEGLADYHAFGTSCRAASGCRTSLLSTSLSEAQAARRDIRQPRCMTQALRDALLMWPYDRFSGNEYTVGTILASALYRAGESVPGGHGALQRSVVAAYSDSSVETPGLAQRLFESKAQSDFTLVRAVRSLLQHVADSALREAACDALLDQLQIPRDSLTDVCPAATSGTALCPAISP